MMVMVINRTEAMMITTTNPTLMLGDVVKKTSFLILSLSIACKHHTALIRRIEK
jgi:hypothetical protein